jgi:hypothetical protein
VHIEQNSFGNKLLAQQPFEALCFPFAQHFLTTSFPTENPIKNEADLEKAFKQFNESMK